MAWKGCRQAISQKLANDCLQPRPSVQVANPVLSARPSASEKIPAEIREGHTYTGTSNPMSKFCVRWRRRQIKTMFLWLARDPEPLLL